jgi:hypothetical protein
MVLIVAKYRAAVLASLRAGNVAEATNWSLCAALVTGHAYSAVKQPRGWCCTGWPHCRHGGARE